MAFTSDRQRKAAFANMMSGPISGMNRVKFSSGPKKDQSYKLLEEAVNEGYWTCPKCGNKMEPDVGTCSCGFKARELIDLGFASEFSCGAKHNDFSKSSLENEIEALEGWEVDEDRDDYKVWRKSGDPSKYVAAGKQAGKYKAWTARSGHGGGDGPIFYSGDSMEQAIEHALNYMKPTSDKPADEPKKKEKVAMVDDRPELYPKYVEADFDETDNYGGYDHETGPID